MCFGTAQFIDDADEKLRALKGVVDRFYPGRTKTLRPIDPQEFKATTCDQDDDRRRLGQGARPECAGR